MLRVIVATRASLDSTTRQRSRARRSERDGVRRGAAALAAFHASARARSLAGAHNTRCSRLQSVGAASTGTPLPESMAPVSGRRRRSERGSEPHRLRRRQQRRVPRHGRRRRARQPLQHPTGVLPCDVSVTDQDLTGNRLNVELQEAGKNPERYAVRWVKGATLDVHGVRQRLFTEGTESGTGTRWGTATGVRTGMTVHDWTTPVGRRMNVLRARAA